MTRSPAATPFAILLGGTLVPTPRLAAQLEGARIIAADGGMAHADMLGLIPELWVGDFDSSDAALRARHAGVTREAHDAAKAKSDGELAIDAARRLGATSLVLAGALGGDRADHQMMILANAAALAAEGVPVLMTSGREEATILLPGRIRIGLPVGTVFSVIGFSDLGGLSIAGGRWPLNHIDVPFGSTLTLSNIAEGPVTLALESGRAAVFCHFDAEA